MGSGLGADFTIIAIYFVGLVGVGLFSSKLIKNVDDFAYSKGRLGFPLLLGTLLASAVGASATIGRAGKAYEYGLIIFTTCAAFSVGLYLFSYIGPILRRNNIVSIPDVMEYRYGALMRMLIAIIIPVAIVGVAGIQIMAFGLLSAALLEPYGVDYRSAVLVGAVIITVYTLVGGMMAVAYTDVFQVIIMIVAIGVLLTVFVVAELGGAAKAVEMMVPEPGNFLGGLSLWYLFGVFLIEVPLNIVDPALWQRSASAKSVKDLVRALRLTSILFMVWGLIAVAFGIWASNLMPGITPDAAVPTLVSEYMPPVARGLAIAALLALIMSTADTSMLVAGTTVALDVVRPLKPDLTDRQLILITRLTILIVGGLATVIALTTTGIFDLMMFSFSIFLAGTFVPIIGALFWKHAHPHAAVASVILATATLIGLRIAANFGYSLPWLEPVVIAFAVSLISFCGISRMLPIRTEPAVKNQSAINA